MFNIEGGFQNALIAVLNILTIVIFVVIPIMFSMIEAKKFGINQIIIGVIGFVIYCFLLYVANPGLTFWAVK